jgi:hypothetical protein
MKRVASTSNATRQALDRAITVLLNGDVSPQTRSILDRQIKEGVPVKGELNNEADEEGDSVMADDQPGRRPGNRDRARGERRLARLGLADARVKTVEMSAAELEAAKVFGLVLGSPEFQRR